MIWHDEVWVETLAGEEVGRGVGGYRGGGCVDIFGGIGGGCDEGKEGAEEGWEWEVHCCIANCEGGQLAENESTLESYSWRQEREASEGL